MTKRRPFLWCRLTARQSDLLERLAAAGSTLPYDKLQYMDLVALDELRRYTGMSGAAAGRNRCVPRRKRGSQALRQLVQISMRVMDGACHASTRRDHR